MAINWQKLANFAPDTREITNRSLSHHGKAIFTAYKRELAEEEKFTATLSITPEIVPSRAESPKPIEVKAENVSPPPPLQNPEKESVVEPKDEKFYSYSMDAAEKWENGDNLTTPPEDIADFWPPGLTIDQHASFERLRKELRHAEICHQMATFLSDDYEMLVEFLKLLFHNMPTFDILVDGKIGPAHARQFGHIVFMERVIWKINGTGHLRQSLLQMRKLEYPQYKSYFEIFQLPCQFSDSFKIQKTYRHDTVIHTSRWISNDDHQLIPDLEIDYYDDEIYPEIYQTEWDGICPGRALLDQHPAKLPICMPDLATPDDDEKAESTVPEQQNGSVAGSAPSLESISDDQAEDGPVSPPARPHSLLDTLFKDARSKAEKAVPKKPLVEKMNSTNIAKPKVIEVKDCDSFTGRAPKFGENWEPKRKDTRLTNEGDSRSFPSRKLANSHQKPKMSEPPFRPEKTKSVEKVVTNGSRSNGHRNNGSDNWGGDRAITVRKSTDFAASARPRRKEYTKAPVYDNHKVEEFEPL